MRTNTSPWLSPNDFIDPFKPERAASLHRGGTEYSRSSTVTSGLISAQRLTSSGSWAGTMIHERLVFIGSASLLFQLDVRTLDKFRIPHEIHLDQLGELLRRADQRIGAERYQRLGELRCAH